MGKRLFAVSFALLLAFSCSRLEEPMSPVPDAEDNLYTLRAGFEGEAGTRSRLEADNGAFRVLWTQNDAFKTLAYDTGGTLRSTTFTTQEDGVPCATFTSSKTLSGQFFASGYPSTVFSRIGAHNTEDDSFILITPVPSHQQAVAGGVAEGLNMAVAWSDRFDTDLTFHNILSFVRFRLEGGIVPEIADITFEAGTTVAGEASVYLKDGQPTIDFSHNWTVKTEERAHRIILNGPFVAGQDYCFAMVPASLPAGFDLVFRDAGGNEITKHSSKALTLSRSRAVDFGTISVGDSWEREEVPEVVRYLTQTRGDRKNTICVLGDGFTQEELPAFLNRAEWAMDYLFSVEPYKSYKECFNVYFLPVASHESGASVTDGNGTVIQEKDTYFKSAWGEDSYSDMGADADIIRNFIQDRCPDIVSGELSYRDVPVLLLVNDIRYGGRCKVYSGGWSYCIVPYQKAGGYIRWGFPNYQAVNAQDDSEGYRETTDEEKEALGKHVGDWRNTVLHEFGGHGYGRLSDEYWSTSYATGPGKIAGHTYTVPHGLNISGYYDPVPWKEDFMDHLDEWVGRNPDYARIGIFQGANSSLYFRWRSEMVSCMIDNRPYFSAWQRMLIVRRIMQKAGETFDLDEFIARDVTVDPIRPAAGTSREALLKARSQALMVPEMPMLPPPVLIEDE